MEPDRWRRLQEVFDAAIELTSEEREPYLDRACEGDPDLRQRVESLIASSEQAGSFIEGAVHEAAEAASAEPDDGMIGTRLGPYELIGRLGRGGMGEVFLASRADDQYRKRVAIKLLREGIDDPELLRRFRSERQILANLEHANIARLLDGGSTTRGTPYVVMEHIEGQRIDDYCRTQGLSVRQRLELFVKVCSAVQHAHQNLIVHRDLKPANILVTTDGVPKLLDFGIAKPLRPELLPHTVAQTRADVRVLTPDYASPEQVRGDPVTTTSDVYSLGVLLYGLLTGRRPYRLVREQQRDWERVICEKQPERPSVAVSQAIAVEPDTDTTGSTGPTGPTGYDVDPRSISRQLSGDLDNIVLMAMRKEPSRRYASVAQMADDIQRHMDGLPVIARADTWRYRVGKFVRRNKLSVAAAAAFVLLLVAFGVTMAVQAHRIAAERDTANRERANALEVSQFLVDIFSVSDPSEARGNDIRAREILDEGAARIRSELAGQPELQASLMSTIGMVYEGLGLYEEAESLQRDALQIQQERGDGFTLAEARNRLASVLKAMNRFEEAETLYRQSLEGYRKSLPGDHEAVSFAMNNLGFMLHAVGNYEEARPLLLESLEMLRRVGQDDEIAVQLNNLGMLESDLGNYAAAEPYLREALELRRRALDDPHPLLALSLSNLGGVFHDRGDYEETERYYTEALEMRRRLFGEEHPDVAGSLNNLAMLYQDTGDLTRAEQFYRESLELHQRLLGREHGSVATVMNNLAVVLRTQGRLDDAERLFREALDQRIRLYGEEHVSVAISKNSLANLASQRGDHDAAAKLFGEVHALLVKLFDDSHPYVAITLANLGSLHRDREDYIEAERYLRQALELQITHQGQNHPAVGDTLYQLGRALAGKGDAADAERTYRRSLDVMRRSSPEGNLNAAYPLVGLGTLLVEQDRADEAEPLLREGLEIRRAALPQGHAEIARAESALGACLVARENYDEAEQLLLSSRSTLIEALGEDDQATHVAENRLVQLYESWGRPEQAAAYR